ncbi:hypothetical protein [Ralstonia sp. RL]|uniref:hypothetical protein n=1 Tax=Ralstonia sp. RL TaxID=1839756 RepID=UPI00257F97EB|nr:hypothetical protein [Ralstonia sp. RL]
MSYPLYDTFATAPAAAYTTVLGSMSASYNSAQQAIDISAPNAQSILRFNEAANGDFWFEADIELLIDPGGRKHIGLWLTTGNGAEGYRFAHLDGAWGVSRWNSGFGDGAAVSGSINDGAKSIAGVASTAPTFNVGQRMTLRCEVIVGAFDANGVPWARLIQFKAGGVLLFQVGDATYRGKLIPGVFLYGATARVHAIAGDTPSGLPAFPATVAVNAANDLLPLAGGTTSVLPDPASPVGVAADCDLMRRSSPASDLWHRPGGYDRNFHVMQPGRKDIHFSGHGVIAGTVKEKGLPDQPLVRRVQLISENANVLVAETWSDAAGNYRFEFIDAAQRYTVVSYDYKHLYRAVIADNLKPEPMP